MVTSMLLGTEIPLQELKPARHGFPSFGVFYER